MKTKKDRVLVIGDTHLPAEHPDYLEFLVDTHRKYKCNKVVHIGDVVDHHCISNHPKHTEAMGPTTEHALAVQRLKKYTKAFPKVHVCIGNHDDRYYRLAGYSNIPSQYLKEYSTVFDTPGWQWAHSWTFDNVLYIHGNGAGGGQYPAWNTAKLRSQPTVMGHTHHIAGVCSLTCDNGNFLWGMNVGCGVNTSHYMLAYDKLNQKKPVLSCGVVIEGVPQLIFMRT